MTKHFTNASIPARVSDSIVKILTFICNRTPLPQEWPSESIAAAVQAQQTIGFPRMALGLFSIEWNNVLEKYNVQHPQTEMEMLIDSIWEEFCEALWRERNDINNNAASFTKIDEMNNLREKMQWYHSHREEVLHYTHQHLVNFDIDSIQRMSRSTMLEYIELLNIARIFYEKETSQLATNQSTIPSWIDGCSSIAQRV